MKKLNILITVFSILAAASVARAQEADFDGARGLKPQSMHEIFAAGHPLVQAGEIQPALVTKKLMGPGSGDCCTDPTVLCYAPCEPDISDRAVSPEAFKALAKYYSAQPKLKTVMEGYYLARGEAAAAAKLGDKNVRVVAAGGMIAVIGNGRVDKISDAALAAELRRIALGGGSQKGASDLIEIGGDLIDIASNNAVWNAVGDAVSATSQAYTEWYYTHGPGSGSRD